MALFLTYLLTQFFSLKLVTKSSQVEYNTYYSHWYQNARLSRPELEHTLGSARRLLYWRWWEPLLVLHRSAFPFSSLDWQLQGSCLDRLFDVQACRFCSGTGDESDEGVPRQNLRHVDSFDRGCNVRGFLTFPLSKLPFFSLRICITFRWKKGRK